MSENPPSSNYSQQTHIHGWGETQYFGPTSSGMEYPKFGYSHFHTGLDIGTPSGTEIHTTQPAKVLFAGWDNSGYGNRVVLEESESVAGGNVVSTFNHLSEIDVKRDQILNPWDLIGKTGSTGNSTGPHLHWEVLYPDAADPSSPYKVSDIPDTNVTGYTYEDPTTADPSAGSWSTEGSLAGSVHGTLSNIFQTVGSIPGKVADIPGDIVKAAGDTLSHTLMIFGVVLLGIAVLGVGVLSMSKGGNN